jgi:hypothetical protein
MRVLALITVLLGLTACDDTVGGFFEDSNEIGNAVADEV